ncbi:uncharacterized protein DNG_10412 [Cephalotrichum gorgonifer]|uniref:ARB-07466-like C-terminal domain-containing protein n=1 Tax=Cephalotrichum gorgonifer TaxID=2041049 RepID=A0AAE8N7P1_9PEZI|nr:uncharacterized protein DNG_10412 [Cephalotrichum gorgonifer]
MKIQNLLTLASLAATTLAATNEPCIGSGGRAGVCVSTSTCSASGGTSISGACPGDAADIKCCTKASCSNGSSGNCRWQSDCAGTSVSNQCPGPAQMKCCSSTATGFGGYAAPKQPTVGTKCLAVSVAGAKKITDQFPGRVREIFCARDCACTSGSDHCCGKAVDLMCSDGGGVPTMSGREIAEWVMKNRSALNLKYVIWGQRIWNPSIDSELAWTSWRGMEDRGDITQNHWDHVHVSFK